MPTPSASSRGASLTVTSNDQVTLRKELHAQQVTGTINGFIGLLAGRSSHRASLQVLQEVSSAGLTGLVKIAPDLQRAAEPPAANEAPHAPSSQ
jgi:hypothetical protein